jgi:YD repeat-containing protein
MLKNVGGQVEKMGGHMKWRMRDRSASNDTYDHMGRTTTVTDAVGDLDYAYNSLGQLVTVTDSLDHETTNTYETAFPLAEVVDEIGKETHYFYDAAGRQESVGAGTSGTVDPTTYNYDPTTGQLASVEYGSSTYTASYEYDGEGRLVKLTDWFDAVDGLRYGYDAVGRLETITDYDDSVLTYTYDDGGNVLSMVDYHGNTTSYTYNDIGQLDTLTAPGSKVWDYTYDAGNRLTRVNIPNDMHTEYTYPPAADLRHASGRQDSIHHKDGATVKQGAPRGLSGAEGAPVGGDRMKTSRAAWLGYTAIGPSPAFKNAGRSRTRSGSRRAVVRLLDPGLFRVVALPVRSGRSRPRVTVPRF